MDEPRFSIKQQPHSLEAEQALLGSILTDSERINDVAFLSPDDFFLEQHKAIYSALIDMLSVNQTIDMVTVVDAVEKTKAYVGVDAVKYLKLLVDMASYGANVKEYGKIIHEKSVLRKLIAASREISDDAYAEEQPVDVLIDSAEQRLFDISNNKFGTNFVHIKDTMKDTLDHLAQLRDNPQATEGIKTALQSIDNMIISLGPGDLVLIGARPGMGKTTLCMNIAVNVAKQKMKTRAASIDGEQEEDYPEVAVFSLEMTPVQLAERLLASESFVDNEKMRKGDLTDDDWRELSEAASRLARTNILIDDSTDVTVMAMRSKLRRLKNLRMVIIDYLQLMKADNKKIDNRVLEIAEITRGLKIMAKDLGVPIILCSQLRREGAKEGKKPNLTDLRDSGAIEQDADIVMFLHREGYNTPEKDDKNSSSAIVFTECIVAKNRHGATGLVKLGWYSKNYKFVSVDNTISEIPE